MDMSRLLTAEQAAALLGVSSSHVRGSLAARLGELIVGYTASGRPRRRFPMDVVQAYDLERRQHLAILEAEKYERETRKPLTPPQAPKCPSRKGGAK